MKNNPDNKVIIIDDDLTILKSLRILLEVFDYQTVCFESALDFLQAYTPDFAGYLLIDLQMPGMSGVDLLRELKRRDIRMPVVIMTAYADKENIQRVIDVSQVAILEKPFASDELRRIINAHLSQAA